MRVRLGVSTGAYYGRMETEEAAAHLATLGLECCEVFLETFSEYSAAFAGQVRGALGGLPVYSIHPHGTQYEAGLFSQSARQRADAWAILTNVLDAGQALGARVYVFHGAPDLRRRQAGPNQAAHGEALARMCALAAARGMVIGWENVSWAQLTRPEHVQRLRDAVPALRFVLDIKQARESGVDPLDFVAAMGDRLCNVHVCDFTADGTLCLPGQGGFAFPRLAEALRRVGYTGPVILEPYAHLVTSPEAMRAALACLRAALC